ncbi:Ig-like domain-containing protein [Leisingera sp. McT4-56]|uniref:Ig-like domain-containing protein n=1 Tax=Leisingera sp. McT4-56 TaxID=2881255 RepID=UPI001CF827A5|nr:Ig-like domain-containing protein [Leisingera sp. McT4-56]MCB4458142.1 Ig-like domain-containing protein [Leisingera sp. McT4-56]
MPNTAPTAVNDFYVLNEDSFLKVAPGLGLLNNDSDPDPGDAAKLAAILTSGPVNPLFDLNTNGALTYDARYHGPLSVDTTLVDLDYTPGGQDGFLVSGGGDVVLPNGFDSLSEGGIIVDKITYNVIDGQDSDSGIAYFTIIGVNDAPVADDDAGQTTSGGSVLIDALDGDTDVDVWPVDDNGLLAITSFSDINDNNGGGSSGNGSLNLTTDAGGTVTLSGGQILYQAAAGFFGVDTFEYTVEDPQGGSDTGVVRVTVLPANQNPTALDDSYTVGEDDGPVVRGSVLDNDSDPDAGDILAAQLVAGSLRAVDEFGAPIAGPTGVLADFDADGNFTFDPDGQFEFLAEGECAYVAFDYTANDAEGNPDQATVIVKIDGANDPVFGNIAAKNAQVFESGLADGSQDGGDQTFPTGDTVTRVYDFSAELAALSLLDPEGDTIFLTLVDGNGEGVIGSMAGDVISDDYGDWTLLGAGAVITGVSYTHDTSATHSSGNGHNGGVFDTLNLGFTDGTLNGAATAYVLDFTGQPGGTNNVTSASAEIIDDIPLIETGPDSVGSDTVDNKTVAFTANASVSDTFIFVDSADGSNLLMNGIPDTFVVEAGDDDWTITSAVDYQANGDILVIGTSDNGTVDDADDFVFYELAVDRDGGGTDANGNNLAEYTFTQKASPPTIIVPVDFSSVKAGGPQETLTVSSVTFDGFFYSNTDLSTNYDGLSGPLNGDSLANMKIDDIGGGSDDVNPNNAGGIGVGNGNIETAEGLLIDVSAASPQPTGIQFIVQGVGGGIGTETIVWEAWDSGSLVAFGEIELDLTNNTGPKEVNIEPGVAFEELYVGTVGEPPAGSGMDGNDKFRINQVSLITEAPAEDYILPFEIFADEQTVDGDQTAVASWTVEVDGPEANDNIVALDTAFDILA